MHSYKKIVYKNTIALKNYTDSISYSLGLNVGQGLRKQGYTQVDRDVFKVGLAAVGINNFVPDLPNIKAMPPWLPP
jgi:hypothetical protein